MSSFTLQRKFLKAHLNPLICVVTLFWFLGVSCGGENLSSESVSSGNINSEDPVFHGVNHETVLTLAVVDSIGVELGDSNYVFGALGEVHHSQILA